MNKTLRLIRHAKSSWQEPTLHDIDRPLRPKGVRRTQALARQLGPLPDSHVFTSRAKRAHDTARILHTQCNMTKPIEIIQALYTFDAHDLMDCLHLLPDECNDVTVVCHNPAITSLINHLNTVQFDNIVTAGYVELQVTVSKWHKLAADTVSLQQVIFRPELSD
ncbi:MULTISPECIES: phosphoglycerate mutase family protein [unclassified Pseudoalteromonas]|uniref:SixA phosphatase family protein n=1 Tax=unclassified Pseudoalteromonas TaxID=194690 RepID=UPI002097372E|nr:phosphoglycerate mutase family protein [Pseudoalteromonas sp. XMcav2-N]MCO7187268.1 histidine phosphatase family protein [Pseudoalteromonas sp. XMcav2-N]